jgi:hypothetical protein
MYCDVMIYGMYDGIHWNTLLEKEGTKNYGGCVDGHGKHVEIKEVCDRGRTLKFQCGF